MSLNINLQEFKIGKHEREKLHGHKSFLIWFTGLSGSGKSTLANLVEIELNAKGISTYVLDGDNIRNGINKDLNFSSNDRSENIRRIGEICQLMLDAGTLTIATFISPFKIDRTIVRDKVGSDNFFEIYVNTSLEECEKRDVKGLYQKARAGEINNMTGISSSYEAPTNPNLEIFTEVQTVEESVKTIIALLEKKIKLDE